MVFKKYQVNFIRYYSKNIYCTQEMNICITSYKRINELTNIYFYNFFQILHLRYLYVSIK